MQNAYVVVLRLRCGKAINPVITIDELPTPLLLTAVQDGYTNGSVVQGDHHLMSDNLL